MDVLEARFQQGLRLPDSNSHLGVPGPFMGCMLSCFSHVQLLVTPWTIARQAPLSMGFSRQEYWSGLPCPPPGYLPDPGIKPEFLISPALAGGFFTTSATWEALSWDACRRAAQTLQSSLL